MGEHGNVSLLRILATYSKKSKRKYRSKIHFNFFRSVSEAKINLAQFLKSSANEAINS